MGCKGCVKCPDCNTRKIIATFTIKRDLEDGKYLSKGFSYKCKECGREWQEEWEN